MSAKWIKFLELAVPLERKTKMWQVLTIDGAGFLGQVCWYAGWRKYCFFPGDATLYEWQCLRDIAEFCETQTRDHKNRALKGEGDV